MHLSINSEAEWQAAPRFAVTGKPRVEWNPTQSDCGCRHGLGALGDVMTPSQAWQQAASGETGSDFTTGWAHDANAAAIQSLVASGQMSASAFSANCASMPAASVNLFATAGGLAVGTTAAGIGILAATHVLSAATAALTGAFTMGAGVLISVVSMIFAHHSAAVRQEQQLGCAAIAAFNNSVRLMDQAIQSGQLTPSAAAAGLDATLSQASSYLAPSVKHNPCNADCEVLVQMKAIVAYRKSLYAAIGTAPAAVTGATAQTAGTVVPMATSQATTGTPASLTTTQPTAGTAVDLATGLRLPAQPASAMPSWLPIAAVVAGLFFLMGK